MTGNKRKDLTEERAEKLLGLTHQIVGKSEARQRFLPLVNQLRQKMLAVEVTDRDQCVAVMISKLHYDTLVNRLWESLKPAPLSNASELMGSITIVGDLERGSKNAAEKFKQSIKSSAEKL